MLNAQMVQGKEFSTIIADRWVLICGIGASSLLSSQKSLISLTIWLFNNQVIYEAACEIYKFKMKFIGSYWYSVQMLFLVPPKCLDLIIPPIHSHT